MRSLRRKCSILRNVETASSKPGELVLPVEAGQPSSPVDNLADLQPALVEELWIRAEAEPLGLTRAEFAHSLASIGARLNHNLAPGEVADSAQKAAFYRSLHLAELALAEACALGIEAAWKQFVSLHRASLIQAGVAITGSFSLGEELADSLYAELYGLRETDGQRRSPLASYTGRGSLAGWLRTTLVQRFRDHHRRTHREAPLDGIDSPAPVTCAPTETIVLTDAVASTLIELAPEDRLLLVAYYLDRQTLLQISRTVHVHEATISRRLKRLVSHLRKQLLRNLCSRGLSRAAAEEALGADPRDIEINLRALLQTSQVPAFHSQKGTSEQS